MDPAALALDDASPATRSLGPIGVWSNFDHLSATELVGFAGRVEALGFDALWVNEVSGREPVATLGAPELREQPARLRVRGGGPRGFRLRPPGRRSRRLGRAADIRTRIDACHAAGVDHVALIPLAADGRQANLTVVEALAG